MTATQPASATAGTVLLHPAPRCPNARLALFAIRRMGSNGLADARAAQAVFGAFHGDFRRPLILLRVLMNELAETAAGTITIAPCCCCRMTSAESALLTVIARVETQPDSAHLLLSDLLGSRRVDAVLASAAAVAASFADAGRPITS